jgi:predicted enzyme related to lactoylglutathione lyase
MITKTYFAMDLELTTVGIVVPRGDEPAKWYEEKLGFEIGGEVGGHWVVVGPKGTTGRKEGPWYGIHLCPADKFEPCNTGILFLSEDIETTYKELKARGVQFTKELTKESWGTFAMFSDPYGNEFWLMPK